MGRFRMGFAAAAAVLVVALAGCGTERATTTGAAGSGTQGPVTVTSCGREVTFDSPPRKVLAIGSEAPELLAAAGAGDTVTHYAGSLAVPFHGNVKATVERAQHVMEDSHAMSFEAIINTGVDVAIGTDISPTIDIPALAARLDQAGVKLLTVSNYCAGVKGATAGTVADFDDMYADIASYGKLFGTEQVAAASIADLKKRVAAVQAQTNTETPRTAIPLYVNADGPLGAYGGAALVSQQMQVLGLTNAFADVPKRYFEPSSEEIVNAAPDIVFGLHLPTGSSALETDGDVLAELRSRAELSGVPALSTDQTVLPLNFYYTTASPLAVSGLELLAKRLADA